MFGITSWIHFTITEVYAVVLLAIVFRRQMMERKRGVWLKIMLVMLAMYLGQLFYTLLMPTFFFRRFIFSLDRVNFVPFRVLSEWLAHPLNFFGNVLLFMPIGFFEVLLHPAATRKKQLLLSAVSAAVLSLFVEIFQCFTARVSDVDDIILNTIGGVSGALLCMFQQKIGFDRTRIGRILLPQIPRTWKRHMLLNRFCVILLVTMEAVIFITNYIVTIPKTRVMENTAVQTQPSVTSALPTEGTINTEEPPVFSEPTSVPRVYNVGHLELEAQNVLLVRLGDEQYDDMTIFAYGSDELIYPASTLKMLVALTVLDIAGPEESVTIGTEIYIPPLDASRAGLEPGMTMSVHDLLEALLLPSGADAAYALAVYCGRKLNGDNRLSYDQAVSVFVAEMNRKAELLGAKQTTAVNVVGLDENGQLTTCRDILTIAKVFLDEPILAEICGLPADRIESETGKSVSLSNTNKMLHEDSTYYNAGIAGVKTGTTNKAGNCLVSFFKVRGEKFIGIVMNSSYYGKFTDTQRLYEVCAE